MDHLPASWADADSLGVRLTLVGLPEGGQIIAARLAGSDEAARILAAAGFKRTKKPSLMVARSIENVERLVRSTLSVARVSFDASLHYREMLSPIPAPDNTPDAVSGDDSTLVTDAAGTNPGITDVGDVMGMARKDYAALGVGAFMSAVRSMDKAQALAMASRDVFWPPKSARAHELDGRSPGAAKIYDAARMIFHTGPLQCGQRNRMYAYTAERVEGYSLIIRWARHLMDKAKSAKQASTAAALIGGVFIETRVSTRQDRFFNGGKTALATSVSTVDLRTALSRMHACLAGDEGAEASELRLCIESYAQMVKDAGVGDRSASSVIQDKYSQGRRRDQANSKPIFQSMGTGHDVREIFYALFDSRTSPACLDAIEALGLVISTDRDRLLEKDGEDAAALWDAELQRLKDARVDSIIMLTGPGRGIARHWPTALVMDAVKLDDEGATWEARSEKASKEAAAPPKSEYEIWQESLRSLRTFLEVTEAGRKASIAFREGPETDRQGNVTGEMLLETFGFRGIEYGNWVPQDERQAHLNHLYDAFSDLSSMMGLPRTAMSLGGTLGIAIGSRGKGGRRAPIAHYEPSNRAMNITRLRGAGSLAHEFAHALDHFLSDNGMAGNRRVFEATYLSDSTTASEATFGYPSLDEGLSKAMAPKRQSNDEAAPPRWNNPQDPARPPASVATRTAVTGFIRRIQLRPISNYSDDEIDLIRAKAHVSSHRVLEMSVVNIIRLLSGPTAEDLMARVRSDEGFRQGLSRLRDFSRCLAGELALKPSLVQLDDRYDALAYGASYPEKLAEQFRKSKTLIDEVTSDPDAHLRIAAELRERCRFVIELARGFEIPSLLASLRETASVSRGGASLVRNDKGRDSAYSILSSLKRQFEELEDLHHGGVTFVRDSGPGPVDTARRWLTMSRDACRAELAAVQSLWFDGHGYAAIAASGAVPECAARLSLNGASQGGAATERAAAIELLKAISSPVLTPNEISGSWMYASSKAMDLTRNTPYWSTTIELFARGFESATRTWLEANGITNTYLSSAAPAPDPTPEMMSAMRFSLRSPMQQPNEVRMRSTAYPVASEMSAVVGGLMRFSDSLQTIVLPRPDANGVSHDRDVLWGHYPGAAVDPSVEDLDLEQRAEQAIAAIRRILGERVDIGIAPFASKEQAIGAFIDGITGPFGTERPVILLASRMTDGRGVDMLSVARHESFHAARQLLFSPAESMILNRAFASNAKPWYQRTIERAERIEDPMVREHTLEAIRSNPEEAMAYAFQFWADDPTAMEGDRPGVVAGLFDRISLLAERIGNAARGWGFRSARDVFVDLSRGRTFKSSEVTADSEMTLQPGL